MVGSSWNKMNSRRALTSTGRVSAERTQIRPRPASPHSATSQPWDPALVTRPFPASISDL